MRDGECITPPPSTSPLIHETFHSTIPLRISHFPVDAGPLRVRVSGRRAHGDGKQLYNSRLPARIAFDLPRCWLRIHRKIPLSLYFGEGAFHCCLKMLRFMMHCMIYIHPVLLSSPSVSAHTALSCHSTLGGSSVLPFRLLPMFALGPMMESHLH